MKKPVILAIHPDLGVLECLKAIVAPVFSQICRIETFDEQVKAFAAAEEWARETRQISVILLSRQSDYTSSDYFLKQIHEICFKKEKQQNPFHPAHYARTLIFENRDIDEPGILIDDIRRQLVDYLSTSGMDTFQTFREVTTFSELMQIMEKRYEIYKNSSVQGILTEILNKIDIDAYDSKSFQLGLFEEKLRNSCLVGCIRLVTESPNPVADVIQQLVQNFPQVHLDHAGTEKFPLPLLEYRSPEKEFVRQFYEQLKSKGQTVTEPGRFCLDKKYRTLSISRFMAWAIAGLWFAKNFDNAVLCCGFRDRLLYIPLGFQQIPNTKPFEEARVMGQSLVFLFLSRTNIPPKTKEKISLLADRYNRNKSLCHCLAYPDCQPNPYLIGNFSEVDIFCPLKAKSVVNQSEKEQPASFNV